MKTFRFPIEKLSPCGMIIQIKTVACWLPPSLVRFEYWHESHLIGFIICEVGEMGIFKATDILMDGYFKSDEFKKFRKEAGQWN
jgi:hypothetical protein